jgi:RNA polymerase sigma-70 factor (ECF subfamily)
MSRTRDDAADGPGRPGGNARFATTRWSIVLRAGRDHDTGGRDALERLCATYWFPLYAYVRRRGYSPHDAQDLTQAFFARLLGQEALRRADREQGRFRTFLLTALSRFLTDEWEKLRAQKRGGGREVISLDLVAAEHRFGLEPADRGDSPDAAFDRHWALTLLETVLQRLEAEYAQAGKASQFALLKASLIGGRDLQPYAELAAKLGTSEGAVKVAVHRLRKRYRDLLQAEIDETVTTPQEAAEEMRDLFRAVGSA